MDVPIGCLMSLINYVDNRVVEFSRGGIKNLKDFGKKIIILKGNFAIDEWRAVKNWRSF